MTTMDSNHKVLRVEVPAQTSEAPELTVRREVIDGALVITLRRVDGQSIEDGHAGLVDNAFGEPMYTFVDVFI